MASYQSVTPLRLGELWAIPIMLRLALLENLRRVIVRVAAGRRERERAAYWIDRMLEVASAAPAKVVLVLAEMVQENPPLTTAFIAEFASRMQGQGHALVFPITWLEHRVAEQGQTIEMAFQQASQHQAADQVSIGNSIGSLRLLGATDWRVFVETMSAVEHVLRTDPAGVYPRMDFTTRDQYRHAVEEIAKRSPLSEDEVVRRAVELAGKPADGDGDGERASRTGHVGYFLVGRGRRILERSVLHRSTVDQIVRRLFRRFPLATYLGAMVLATAVATGLIVAWAARQGLGPWGLAALGACCLSAQANWRWRRFTGGRCCWCALESCRAWIFPRASRLSTARSWRFQRSSRTKRKSKSYSRAWKFTFWPTATQTCCSPC